MKKRLLSIISVFLVLCVILSSVGCGKSETVKKLDYQGLHELNYTETDDYIVKNGKSDYSVLMSTEPTTKEKKAKDEFLYFFELATGIRLSVVANDSEHSATAKYFSIGNTNAYKTANLTIDGTKLGNDSLTVETKDKTVYLNGKTDGIVYSVYAFLEVTFGFDSYWKDCWDLETSVSEKHLYNYKMQEEPDISYRIAQWGFQYDSEANEVNFGYRQKLVSSQADYLLPIHTEYDNKNSVNTTFHNITEMFSYNTYAADHPKWFCATDALCYTAQGDEEEYKLLVEEAVKKIANSLKLYPPEEYPTRHVATITIEDSEHSCKCAKCLENYEKYGAESGSVILFVNDVQKGVEEWMAKPENAAYARDDYETIFFAYMMFRQAPAKYNDKTKKWEPTHPDMQLVDGANVYLTVGANMQLSIYDDLNKNARNTVESWQAISDKIYFWLYNVNCTHYLYFQDVYDLYNSEGYKYYIANGCDYLFINASYDQSGSGTAFQNYRAYLDAKLAWNCNYDESELKNKYFNAMFREGAEDMLRYFTELRTYNQKLINDNDMIKGGGYNKLENKDLWSIPVLKRWMGICDEAKTKVEKYKTTNPELYESLVTHIDTEWFSPAWILLRNFKDRLSETELNEIVERCKQVVEKTGISITGEHDSAGSVSKWLNNL